MYELHYNQEKSHWWFCARRKIVLDIVRKLHGERIIEFGCGAGAMLQELSETKDVTGLDVSPFALDYSKQVFNGKLIQASLEDELPFKNEYDIGLALDVIEHIEDDLTALKNMEKVVSRGGRLILTCPAFNFLWSAHDDSNEHKRRYTSRELKTLIRQTGFEVECITYYNFWLFPIVAAIKCIFKLLRIDDTSSEIVYAKPPFFNELLYMIFASERFFISRKIKLPFGVSLLVVLKKR